MSTDERKEGNKPVLEALTLRRYYMATVAQGIIAAMQCLRTDVRQRDIVREAYEIADVMLAMEQEQNARKESDER